MYRKTLYMASAGELLMMVDRMLEQGIRIVNIVRLRPFVDPDMNGMPVTDWLIICDKEENTEKNK